MRAWAIFVSVLLLSCGGEKRADTSPGGKPQGKGPVAVRTLALHAERVARTVELSGTLLGQQDAVVASQADGRVLAIAKDMGDAAPRGSTIVALDAVPARLAKDAAQAELEVVLARLNVTADRLDEVRISELASVRRAQIDADDAARTLKRTEDLFEKAVVTQHDIDAARTRAAVADATLQQAQEDARASVAQAKVRRAALGLAERRVADCAITAPFDGVVAERLVNVGEVVKVGQPIVRLVRTDTLRVWLDIPERYASEVVPGQAIALAVDGSATPRTAQIKRLSPRVDESARTFRVEAEIDNAQTTDKNPFLPGRFARATLSLDNQEDVFALPETAVSNLAGQTKIFVVKDGVAHERRVQLLRKRGSDALIVGDLHDGDVAAVTAIARLFDGAEVSVDAGATDAAVAASSGKKP